MGYHDAIEYLYGLQRYGVKFGLSNSLALMEALGHPHRKFKNVHITGTNGKGSTAAFIEAVLRKAGCRTGLYTSPHLVNFTERIRIDNVPVSEDRVVGLADRVRKAADMVAKQWNGVFSPTFFEVTTAMAFLCFAEEGVDIAVVEVGMGGRLDATNVITPLVSVITNIGMDHAEFLGDTLDKIAHEKAGIIKLAVPLVTGGAPPEALDVIEKTASERAAPVYRLNRDFGPHNVRHRRPHSFEYHGICKNLFSVRVGMMGMHQIDNACLSLAAIECLGRAGLDIDDSAVLEGMASCRWEGRLELVSEQPDIILDGAHNPHAAQALAAALKEMKPDYERIVLVIGILSDKDCNGILSELAPLSEHIIATQPEYSRALNHSVLASAVEKYHGSVEAFGKLSEAIDAARTAAGERGLVLITGSLYLVGEARALLVPGAALTAAMKGLKG